MKRVEDYSQAELLALSEEDIAKLAEIECMIDGVQMVPPPGVEPVFGEKLEKHQYFLIGDRLLYPTAEAAAQAAALAVRTSDYESLDGVYSAKLGAAPNIQLGTYYHHEDLMQVKDQKNAFEREKSAWNSRERQYNNYCDKKRRATGRVYDAVRNAQDELGAANDRVASYTKYVELAGDPVIATRFFREMLKKQDWSDDEIDKEVIRVTDVVAK